MNSCKQLLLACCVVILTACGGTTTPPANDAASAPTVPAAATSAPAPTSASQSTAAPISTEAVTAAPEATEMATAEATTAVAATIAPGSTEATGAVPSGDPHDVLLKAMRASVSGGPYRSTTVVDTAGNQSTIEGEIIPPNKYHITTKGSGTSSEMIIIGDKAWMNTNGRWAAFPAGAQILSSVSQLATDPKAMGIKLTNVTFVGPDVVEGNPTWVYTYDSAFGEGAQAITSKSKTWISVASGKPVKVESDTELSGIKSKTTQTITYDDSITIEPPAE